MRRFPLLVLLFAAPAAAAGDFRSIGDNAVPMYDAPSIKANALFVASKFYPVEVIVQVDNWNKVRDVAGDLAWVEKKNLSDTRTVLVTAELADVRESPEDTAPLVFQARKGVALEVVELGAGPWVKVRHRGGQTGFVRANQVWGL
ncbi:MAG: SH3 domain-containing protein [Burkholderiales bacterium]|nr:SH3 domain-containing protein [Burkholderiales bacterium]